MDRGVVSCGFGWGRCSGAQHRSIAPLRGPGMTGAGPKCLGCGAVLTHSLVDLGGMPLANAFVAEGAAEPDPAYPLHAQVCDRCLLVQVEPAVPPQAIFNEYAY